MNLQLDHLVVAARTLDEGVAWCERTLGVVARAGGTHPLMGTHNRVISIAGPAAERAYLEIIAVDPLAAAPVRVRWFDLDDPQLRRDIEVQPRLVHWVARTDDIDGASARLRSDGLDTGRVIGASRATAAGELRWRITVRDDGKRPLGGVFPTLIQWDGIHPADAMEPSGVSLTALRLRTNDIACLGDALKALGAPSIVEATEGPTCIVAELQTSTRVVVLSSAAEPDARTVD